MAGHSSAQEKRLLTRGEARREAISRQVEELFAARHRLMCQLAALLINADAPPTEDDPPAPLFLKT